MLLQNSRIFPVRKGNLSPTRGAAMAMSLACGLTLMALGAPAHAKCVTVAFSVPYATGEVTLSYDPKKTGASPDEIAKVKITKDMSAEAKRDKIFKALPKKFKPKKVQALNGNPGIQVCDLTEFGKILFDSGLTKEDDILSSVNINYAALNFDLVYSREGLNGKPASFKVGVLTDRGQVEYTYNAVDTVPGEIIYGAGLATRLVEGLRVAANDLGARLDLNGNQIMVTFDTGVSKTGAGVTFQSTANSGGISGVIEAGDPTVLVLDIDRVLTPVPDFGLRPIIQNPPSLNLTPGN